MSGAPTDVRDDATASRFVIAEDGVEAELLYRKRAGRLILIHTEVPDGSAAEGSAAGWSAPRSPTPGPSTSRSGRGARSPGDGSPTTVASMNVATRRT
jgi:hypothetical protein